MKEKKFQLLFDRLRCCSFQLLFDRFDEIQPYSIDFDYRMFDYIRRETKVILPSPSSPSWSWKQLTWSIWSNTFGSQRFIIPANLLQSVFLFWLTCSTELYFYAKKFVFSWPHTQKPCFVKHFFLLVSQNAPPLCQNKGGEGGVGWGAVNPMMHSEKFLRKNSNGTRATKPENINNNNKNYW